MIFVRTAEYRLSRPLKDQAFPWKKLRPSKDGDVTYTNAQGKVVEILLESFGKLGEVYDVPIFARMGDWSEIPHMLDRLKNDPESFVVPPYQHDPAIHKNWPGLHRVKDYNDDKGRLSVVRRLKDIFDAHKGELPQAAVVKWIHQTASGSLEKLPINLKTVNYALRGISEEAETSLAGVIEGLVTETSDWMTRHYNGDKSAGYDTHPLRDKSRNARKNKRAVKESCERALGFLLAITKDERLFSSDFHSRVDFKVKRTCHAIGAVLPDNTHG